MDKNIFTQEKAQQFADILRDAVTSYIDHKNSVSVKDWLFQYLTDQLPEKTSDELSEITESIVDTVTAQEKQVDSLNAALKAGKSVESWFSEELDKEKSVGEQAKDLVECHAALTNVSNEYSEADEQQETIEVEEIPPEEWEDSNWNKYKMKDLVTETVMQAGEVALKTAASDLYQKVTEYGFNTVLCNKELITDSLLNGASAGIKAATAGAIEIANIREILPTEGNTSTRALLAGLAVDNVKVLGSIANGDMSISEGLAMIKNNTVATVSTIVKEKLGINVGAAIGSVLGPAGTAIGAFVGGAVAKFSGTKVGSKVVSAAKTVCSAAKSVASKVSSTVKSIGSKVLGFFRRR